LRNPPLSILLAGSLLLTVSAAPAHPQEDPQSLVRRAAHNELDGNDQHLTFRFILKKTDEKGTTTKEIVETKDGDVARLIERNGQPLTPDEENVERKRLDDLLADPDKQARRHKREQQDAKRGDELVQVLPNAFLYKFSAVEQGPNGPAYKLSFQPDPRFTPPDYEARVFHGMAGDLWVDQKQTRMVRFDAHLISDVDFGWGVLGKLYKGGTITVEQKDVGSSHWEQTHMKLNLTGREMMVKDLKEQTTEDESSFHLVPSSWTYQDAVHFLQSQSAAQLKQ
jgi:hypothetical protein